MPQSPPGRPGVLLVLLVRGDRVEHHLLVTAPRDAAAVRNARDELERNFLREPHRAPVPQHDDGASWSSIFLLLLLVLLLDLVDVHQSRRADDARRLRKSNRIKEDGSVRFGVRRHNLLHPLSLLLRLPHLHLHLGHERKALAVLGPCERPSDAAALAALSHAQPPKALLLSAGGGMAAHGRVRMVAASAGAARDAQGRLRVVLVLVLVLVVLGLDLVPALRAAAPTPRVLERARVLRRHARRHRSLERFELQPRLRL
mmetsp:Transcript_3165/g.11455  ORF Transcript_3165/g.11455 Transcript_3165/m.11455 type:complete len:258 (+) Transcript_3165:934-1707(+)